MDPKNVVLVFEAMKVGCMVAGVGREAAPLRVARPFVVAVLGVASAGRFASGMCRVRAVGILEKPGEMKSVVESTATVSFWIILSGGHDSQSGGDIMRYI